MKSSNPAKKNYITDFLKGYKLILLCVFILGLFLRLYGSYPGYPQTNADESTIQGSANQMALHGDYEPANYYYGSLLPLLYSVTFKNFYMPARFPQFLVKNASHLRFGPFTFYDKFIEDLEKGINLTKLQFYDIPYWSRYNTAILSSFSILLVFILGKRLFNIETGLAAAFFTAVNLRHVISSRLALADAPAAVFIMIALVSFTNLLQKTSIKNYLFSGVAMGLAFSVKYFIYIIPTFFLCHLLVVFSSKNTAAEKIRNFFSIKKLVLCFFIAVLLFIIINPYLLIKYDEASAQLAYNSTRYNLSLSWKPLTKFNIQLFPAYYMYHFGITPVLSIITLFGFIYALIHHPKSSLIISSVIIPYIYIFYFVSGTGMVRNYASILPLVLIFPAVFLVDLTKNIQNIFSPFHRSTVSKHIFKLFLVFLIFIAGFESLQKSFFNSYYFSKENSLTSVYNYMNANIPEQSRILGMNAIFYPSKDFTITNMPSNNNLFATLDEIKNSGSKWVVLGFDSTASVFEGLLANQDLLRGNFFNQDSLWELYSQHYQGLAFKQLADYRIAQFVKPDSQDPSFIIIKFPDFYFAPEENNIITFNFDNPEDIEKLSEDFYPANSYKITFKTSDGINRSGAVQISEILRKCRSDYYKISTDLTPIEPNKWITLTAFAKRDSSDTSKFRNGFLRIDLYSKDKSYIKTYVTKPLSTINQWELLVTAGQTPKDANFARISFVVDACIEYESYFLDEVKIFSGDNPAFNLKDYPYYDIPLSQQVFWTSPL